MVPLLAKSAHRYPQGWFDKVPQKFVDFSFALLSFFVSKKIYEPLYVGDLRFKMELLFHRDPRDICTMECYAMHFGLWRSVRYCRYLWLPLPLPSLFPPDLANKACPFALLTCRQEAKSCKLQLPQVKFKMFVLSPLSYIIEGVKNHFSLKTN